MNDVSKNSTTIEKELSRWDKARSLFPRSVKVKLLLILIGIIVGAQIETLTLSVIQPFIMILTEPDVVYTNQFIHYFYRIFNFRTTSSFLALLAVLIALVYTFRGLYIYFFARVQNWFIATNTAKLSNHLLTQTLKQPYLYHASRNVVDLQRIVTKNAERLFSLISNIISLLADGFMSLFILIFLMVSSPSMTVVVLFLSSICILVYFKIFKGKIAESGEDEAKGVVLINKSIIQALHGIKEIKVMQSESHFVKKFKVINLNTIKTRAQILSLRQLPKLFIESLCFSGAFLVVSGMIFVGTDTQALVPQLGLFVLAGFKLLPAISRLVNNVTQIIRLKNAVEQVYDGLFGIDENFKTHLPSPLKKYEVTQDIKVKEVAFKYHGAKKPIFRKITLTIPHNKSVAIIGPSGAGKSTFVDIILGILNPQQGYVIHNGKSIHHNMEEWLSNVGYIPQSIYIMDETILANIAFGLEDGDIDEEQVWNALEQAQLKEYVQSLPDGLNTLVGDRGIRLSGGQRQRIGIARALYRNPSILVLDEATSSLDNDTEAAVMDGIKKLKGNKTIIIVAHRLSTIEHCDIVFEVNKGTVKQKTNKKGEMILKEIVYSPMMPEFTKNWGVIAKDYYKIRFRDDGYPAKYENEKYFDHPIHGAHVIRNYLSQYETNPANKGELLDAIVTIADASIKRMKETENGEFIFLYPPGIVSRGKSKWHYSGLTQSYYATIFYKIYEITGLSKFKNAAEKSFKSLLIPANEGGVFYDWGDGRCFIEEVKQYPNSFVLNGWMTTLFSIHEYYQLSGNDEALNLFMRSVKSLESIIHLYDSSKNKNSCCGLTGYQSYRLTFKPFDENIKIRKLDIYYPSEGIFPVQISNKSSNKWDNYIFSDDIELTDYIVPKTTKLRMNIVQSKMSYPELNKLLLTIESMTTITIKLEVLAGSYNPLKTTPELGTWQTIKTFKIKKGINKLEIPLPLEGDIPYPTNFLKEIGGKFYNVYHYIHIDKLRKLYEITKFEKFKQYADKWDEYTSFWPGMEIYKGVEHGPVK